MVYLAATCGVVWVGTFLYLLYLTRRERALEIEIRELRTRLVGGDISGTAR